MTHPGRRAVRQRGISMIEVIVVVSIVGILAVAVAPEISIQLRNSRVRNVAESMQNGLQRARAEAIARNQNVRFTLVSNLTDSCVASSSAASWVVSLDDPAGLCDIAPDPTVEPRTVTLQEARDGGTGATVSATQGSPFTTAASSITFNPFGRPINTTQMARVVVDSAVTPSQHRSYRIDISPVGSVRMCDRRVTATDDPRYCP
ncbi:MAG: GspH/FimT family protein [Ideonella sp.]|nr:GspH/FimT family protein [Ideonella sp.]